MRNQVAERFLLPTLNERSRAGVSTISGSYKSRQKDPEMIIVSEGNMLNKLESRKTGLSPTPQCLNTDSSKAVHLLWFLTVTCSCCPYLYFGSPIVWVTYLARFRSLNDHLSGKELLILFTARALRKLLSIYVCIYFPFVLGGRIWDLIVSVPDHCLSFYFTNEPPHDKTSKMVCAPSEDSDQSGHPPRLIRVFAVRPKSSCGHNVSSCGQWRLWSDWADAQADLSPHWAQRSIRFCHEAAKS